jgi:hypothetical protein
MPTDLELFDELSYYTLAHSDPSFVHQNAVDAFTAQNADADTKPIAIVFALAGLYLYVEKNFTGRQVQIAHIQLARRRKKWSKPPLPDRRGSVRVGDVLAEAPGPNRDAMIHCWCISVWEAFQESREETARLLAAELDIT